MSKPVLFVTGLGRPLERAENIRVLYDYYPGDKKFCSTHDLDFNLVIKSGKYDRMVIDVFPTSSPGKTLMIWHAIQGGKHIGLDEKDTYYRPWYSRYIDRIVVAGHGAVDMFNQCTGIPKERILNMGMPRTDRYIGKKKGDGHTIMAKKRAYLYVPTFRTRNETPLPKINWQWLNDNLTDDEIFVVKSHPYTRDLFVPNLKRVVEVSGIVPSVNYLYDADVVITDYSSIMFDAYLLNTPVVLFEKLTGYTTTRGMYMDYPDSYCSRYAMTEHELLDMVRSADGLTETERNCIDFVADACDGNSCERICKLIDQMEGW